MHLTLSPGPIVHKKFFPDNIFGVTKYIQLKFEKPREQVYHRIILFLRKLINGLLVVGL